VEAIAAEGDPRRHALPRPLLGRPGCDFSFSGLKTAVARIIAGMPPGPLDRSAAADIAASFQAAVADVLADRAGRAMDDFATRHGAGRIVVAGGVAANQAIRAAILSVADARGFTLSAPPIRLCTDNAVMVAWAGIERLRLGLADPLDHAPRPRWPLEAL
jgi:N6-L-threonylcarbamoyladenine synthase